MKSSSPTDIEVFPRIERKRFDIDPTLAVCEMVSARQEWFERAVDAGYDALRICRAYSDTIDQTVSILYDHSIELAGGSAGVKSAVLALGGYGRREMGFSTDVDLLFLTGTGSEVGTRAITDGILYPFWDSGIEVGGATRTVEDCAFVMDHDARALTAMMEARLVAGDAGLYDGLQCTLRRFFASRSRRRAYVRKKLAEHAARLDRFGGSIYLLQPNIKEGEGGLREIQTLRWVASALRAGMDLEEALAAFVPEERARRELSSAHAFLWAARHALHLVESSSRDKLLASLQGAVSLKLGYAPKGEVTAAEAFMSDYYRHGERLHLICERGLEAVRRELKPPSRMRRYLKRRTMPRGIVRTEFGTLALQENSAEEDVRAELELFAVARNLGAAIDATTKGRLTTRTGAWPEGMVERAEVAQVLRRIFSGLHHLAGTLRDMHECGSLERWFPEMVPMLHRVQHDGFHFYTAGVHSIKAVEELSNLVAKNSREDLSIPKQALGRIRRRHVLALATLLHDVGKGRGGDHSGKGAELAAGIMTRLQYDASDRRDVEYLVRSHLLMSTLAFKRDIKDPELVERFAQSVRSPEVLAMLYLLTFADIRAIGPHIWSDWKGGLLGELYVRAHDLMEAGGMTPSHRKREVERVVAAVMKRVGRDMDRAGVLEYLSRLPDRYLYSTSPDAIAAHVLLVRDLASQPLATFLREIPERNCTELSVVTRDCPGLFAKIAGVLALNSANILDAQVSTASDGTAIDVMLVTDATHSMIEDQDVWSKIRRDLAEVLPSDRDMARIVGGRFKRRFLEAMQHRRPTEVKIENDVSAQHTVVEIKTDDRRGLLYMIASAFHELGCSIEVARITTHIDRVLDVFYIRDVSGAKIDSKERLEQVRTRLEEALE